MFQPQPTPFASFASYGLHVANAAIPDYSSFPPTPLGQDHLDGAGRGGSGGGHGHGAGVASPGAGGVISSTGPTVFASPAFHNPLAVNQHLFTPHQNNTSHNHLHQQSQHRRQQQPSGRQQHNVKMEQESHDGDIVQQEAAARDYRPTLEVCMTLLRNTAIALPAA